ncbi:MAG: DNA pilot protein [Arizlama microvirus]|nr:MAG: DNA pilot protein [Arizlama microvirus]
MLGALLGGAISAGAKLLGQKSEQKMQQKFAKNGIQWKVADAQAAGVHPLYALGANTMSYQPVGVGDGFDFLKDMGQNIDRAREATSEAPAKAMTGKLGSLSLERAGLENELLRAEIAKTRAQTGPAMPSVSGGGRDPLTVAGLTIRPDAGETPAQKWEDEYGDWADAIGAGRLIRDVGSQLTDKKILDYIKKNTTVDIREGSVADEIWRWFNNRQISYSGKGNFGGR